MSQIFLVCRQNTISSETNNKDIVYSLLEYNTLQTHWYALEGHGQF